MSRLKVYYPLNEITTNLSTIGGEWMLESLKEYKGLYHTYTTGEVYSGKTYNVNTSKKLIPFKIQTPVSKAVITYTSLKPKIKTKYNSIITYNPIITTDDITKGFITRYFIKKINSNIITEINEDQKNDFESKKIDPNLFIICNIKWVITGPINDVKTGNIVRKSVASQNKKAVVSGNLIMPGLLSRLKNYIELYIGDTLTNTIALNTAPKDINNLDN